MHAVWQVEAQTVAVAEHTVCLYQEQGVQANSPQGHVLEGSSNGRACRAVAGAGHAGVLIFKL